LDDGSQLFLDARTRIAVSFSETARVVDMQYGRANFRIVPDLKRPFIVEAAEHKIIATRCNFDVRCEDGKVQVVLIHGEADVKPASAGDGRGERLKAGERLVASNDVEKRDKPDLTRVLAWQTGYEMFDKETLARVAEEMNRYSTVRLEVDPSAAGLKVSGMYRWATTAPSPNPGKAAAHCGAAEWRHIGAYGGFRPIKGVGKSRVPNVCFPIAAP
jgi:transmembrane sensor